MNLSDLRYYAQDANVKAFLRVIRAGESSQDDSAYTVIFGGSHFTGFAAHPNQRIPFGNTFSTAAGAYQFLHRTWTGLVNQYGFPDFSPEYQDLGAIALIAGRGALQDVVNGDLVAALPKCAREWASLPFSPYGQPTITVEKCEAVFRQYGGKLVGGQGPFVEIKPPETPIHVSTQPDIKPDIKPKENRMGALAMFGPLIAQLIPAVAKLFGGGEVAQRNVAVGQLVLDTAVKAANAVNEQDALDKMKNDPAILQTVTQAVLTEPTIMGMLEVGGGIEKAREAGMAMQQAERPFWFNPVFVVTCMLMPIIAFIVFAVITGGAEGAPWWVGAGLTAEAKTGLINGIIGMILGGVMGIWFGTSYGSMKKDDRAAQAMATEQAKS